MMDIDRNMPVWTLTVGQFSDLINNLQQIEGRNEPTHSTETVEKYSYGLSGLAKLLGCSKTTAWKIKDSGMINKAIKQVGRKIIIDNEKALELFGKKGR